MVVVGGSAATVRGPICGLTGGAVGTCGLTITVGVTGVGSGTGGLALLHTSSDMHPEPW